MPYAIHKVHHGYKVVNELTHKALSKHPLPHSTAIKQRIAVQISEHRKKL